MPTYYFKHPETGEIFEIDRSIKENIEKPHIHSDGVECEFVPWYIIDEIRSKSSMGIVDKNAEVWQKDPSYVKKLNPKYVRRRDGIKEKYDPKRHR